MSEMQRLEAIEKRKKEEIVQIYNLIVTKIVVIFNIQGTIKVSS
jgi:hypothetical protein